MNTKLLAVLAPLSMIAGCAAPMVNVDTTYKNTYKQDIKECLEIRDEHVTVPTWIPIIGLLGIPESINAIPIYEKCMADRGWRENARQKTIDEV